MKVCSKCDKAKELDKFPNHRSRKDGKHPYCKECRRQQARIYRKTDRYKAVATEYNKQGGKDAVERWRQKNKHKRRAHSAVYQHLSPQICAFLDHECNGTIEAHHDDYDKPLNVVWMCRRHHAMYHRS